jgi:hypothetical protein
VAIESRSWHKGPRRRPADASPFRPTHARWRSCSAEPEPLDGGFSVILDDETGIVRARFSSASNMHDVWALLVLTRNYVVRRPVDGVLIDVRLLDHMPSCVAARSLATELARFLGRRRLALVTDSGVVASVVAETIALEASACGVKVDVFHGTSAGLTWLEGPDVL